MGLNYRIRDMNRRRLEISPVSEAKKRANKKWESNNCKQIRLVLPNEQAERLEKFCKENKQSKNGFIKSAIVEKLNREEK